jgi:hypothetical protein
VNVPEVGSEALYFRDGEIGRGKVVGVYIEVQPFDLGPDEILQCAPKDVHEIDRQYKYDSFDWLMEKLGISKVEPAPAEEPAGVDAPSEPSTT